LAGLSDSAFEQVREGNETIAHAIAAVSENKQHKPSLAVVQPLSEPEPKEPEEPEYTELDAAHDTIDFLRAELAVKNAEGSEEDKQQAKNLIESLMAENKTLRASEAAIKKSRDSFQSQVAELKHQIQRQRREIDKLTGGQKTA
jgi:chromosome segregation ATPase